MCVLSIDLFLIDTHAGCDALARNPIGREKYTCMFLTRAFLQQMRSEDLNTSWSISYQYTHTGPTLKHAIVRSVEKSWEMAETRSKCVGQVCESVFSLACIPQNTLECWMLANPLHFPLYILHSFKCVSSWAKLPGSVRRNKSSLYESLGLASPPTTLLSGINYETTKSWNGFSPIKSEKRTTTMYVHMGLKVK